MFDHEDYARLKRQEQEREEANRLNWKGLGILCLVVFGFAAVHLTQTNGWPALWQAIAAALESPPSPAMTTMFYAHALVMGTATLMLLVHIIRGVMESRKS